MAKWIIERQEDGLLRLTYVNPQTGRSASCGGVRADTPVDILVEWIVTKGGPRPGDWIVLPDRRVLLVGRNGARG